MMPCGPVAPRVAATLAAMVLPRRIKHCRVCGTAVAQRARAVRRIIVHEQQVGLRAFRQNRHRNGRYIFLLVISRNDNERVIHDDFILD